MKLNNEMSDLSLRNTKDYGTFFKCMIDNSKTIPNVKTKYIPQGICVIENNILITAYDEEGKDNSIIYIINNNGYQHKVILDGRYHCGGISYDKKNNKVYVTGYGSNRGISYVNVYNYDDILLYNDNKNDLLKPNKKIKVDRNFELLSYTSKNKISSPAFLNVNNSNLFVGNFHVDKGILKKYIIEDNGYVNENEFEIIDNPFPYTQGMCVYNYNNIDYYIFSSSKGRRNNSLLFISILRDNKLVKIGEMVLPCMSEQLCVSGNRLVIIFESCARKYYLTAKNVIESICFLDIDKIIKEICK